MADQTVAKQPTVEELESWRKWAQKKGERKSKGAAKRVATETLKKAHQAEFDGYMKLALAGKLEKPAK